MDEIKFYKMLGKRVKVLRENAHLTQEKLAEKCGISLDYLGKIEVCINKPGLKTIFRLANALEIPIKEFFDFDSLDV
ncbi:helix-turn-helix transcriptional regulator [bacterium]|nr:helix-turn-helix transcriptional regulator [bacterium]